ncbi:hypothetical protein [Pseudodesulfovibrio sp.]|uniref:hypothetical protein n=1 Tax=unclassified Pseudodesulfovibrio TaxID=2661612 RepID=UPI003AFFB5B2
MDFSEEALLLSAKPCSFEIEMANQAEIRKSHEEAQAANPRSRWWMSSGMQEGTFTLKNGNKQVVAIDGDKMEIMEYEGDRLVKSVKGTLYEGGASLDTEFYDKTGKLAQTIHTEIEELRGKNGWTSARMQRSVQWFDAGVLKGDMQDSMQLSSWNSAANGATTGKQLRSLLGDAAQKVSETVDEFNVDTTLEKHVANYYAEVRKLGENGRTVRQTSVEFKGKYTQFSNRSYDDNGSMAARTTDEIEHDTGLKMSIRDYDKDGNLVRDAVFNDEQKDNSKLSKDGKQQQSLAVSWYSGGELVKRSRGSMTQWETPEVSLRDRPSVLEALGLSSEEYLGENPQSAVELLAAGAGKSSSEADYFMEGIMRHAATGDYSDTEDIGKYGIKGPYSVDWTDEIYSDGELVQRQRDSESARETTFLQRERAIMFRTARGLTENEAPRVLRETSHEHEEYEGGKVVNRQTTKARESIEQSTKHPDRVVTDATMTQGPQGKEVTTAFQVFGGVDVVDRDPRGASRGMGDELRITLDDFMDDVRDMNQEDISRSEAHRVNLDYLSMWEN